MVVGDRRPWHGFPPVLGTTPFAKDSRCRQTGRYDRRHAANKLLEGGGDVPRLSMSQKLHKQNPIQGPAKKAIHGSRRKDSVVYLRRDRTDEDIDTISCLFYKKSGHIWEHVTTTTNRPKIRSTSIFACPSPARAYLWTQRLVRPSSRCSYLQGSSWVGGLRSLGLLGGYRADR